MKKLSIIRFKPKPGCFDEFLANSIEQSRERGLRRGAALRCGQERSGGMVSLGFEHY